MADFVELGAEGLDHLTDKYFERGYDKVKNRKQSKKQQKSSAVGSENQPQQRKYRLPSPERERGEPPPVRDREIEEQSETSERVLRAYENERDDPKRRPNPSIVGAPRRGPPPRDFVPPTTIGVNTAGATMGSYATGYAPSQRPNSQQPPKQRYYDDDDSDYDERSGRRQRASGRGYDDDDRNYDREIVETERYRGVRLHNQPRYETQELTVFQPARPYDPRRNSSGYKPYEDQYGAGAGTVAPYKRGQADQQSQAYSRRDKRSKSRGRDRDRSDSRSQSRSRSQSKDGLQGKIDEFFDTSKTGLGVGLAGAVAGALAGREFGNKHRQRDMIIGALVGGLGANAAENKYRDWKDDKDGKLKGDERRWEQKFDGRDGRSRSNVR